MAWRLIPDPKDGDRVVYVGCHAVDWRPEYGRPTVAFVEDDRAAKIEALLIAMKRGSCWCEMAVGNPMATEHSEACQRARKLFMSEEDSDGQML